MSYLLVSASSILLLMFSSNHSSQSTSFFYFPTWKEVGFPPEFCFTLDQGSLIFLFMVIFVVSLVCIYSEFYLELYNGPKFFFLLLSFFLSMLLLSVSSSSFPLMLGWDGLGVTSLCLIMFYPNKTTLYNSNLTMFFNRMGDVGLIAVLSMFLSDPHRNFFLGDSGFFLLILLVLCSFTKSAQFPLSSWLPAAMSAPTPISAMVHSSTLVTAGVCVIYKISPVLFHWNLLIFWISFLTMLLGGAMANLELDTKKVIAFSTMSQISMLLVLASSGYVLLCLIHMLFHAFFKTLLFCTAGCLFMSKLGDQLSFVLKPGSNHKVLSFFLFCSIFSMSGLLFSASFFTKDMFLEFLFMSESLSWSGLFTLSSILTLLYCLKLLKLTAESKWGSMGLTDKKVIFSLYMLFIIVLGVSGPVVKESVALGTCPVVSSDYVSLISLMTLIPLILNSVRWNRTLFALNLELLTLKTWTYEFLAHISKFPFVSLLSGDKFIYTPFNLGFKDFTKASSNRSYAGLLILTLLLLLISYSYSLSST